MDEIFAVADAFWRCGGICMASVLAYWHLAKYFWLLLPFYGTIKETAVISYGKTKKIQNQTYG